MHVFLYDIHEIDKTLSLVLLTSRVLPSGRVNFALSESIGSYKGPKMNLVSNCQRAHSNFSCNLQLLQQYLLHCMSVKTVQNNEEPSLET